MDGEQNIRRSDGDGASGVAGGDVPAAGENAGGGGGGDIAGSIGAGGAGAGDGGSAAAGGGFEQAATPAASVPAPAVPQIGDDGSDDIVLNWKGNESDAEAALAWCRQHAGDQPGKALRIASRLAHDQSLGIRNGDTPVRRNAQTTYRDIFAQLGIKTS